MQHGSVKNTVMATVPPRMQHYMPGADEGEFQTTREEDQITSIIHNQTNSSPTKIPSRTVSEQTISITNNTHDPVTKTTSALTVRMPHPSVAACAADTIDCAVAFAAQKPIHHENQPVITPASVSNGTCENNPHAITPTTHPTNTVSPYHKDGHYFLALVKSEQTRLLAMAEQADHDMYTLTTNANTDNITDEVFGILRSVLGKTKLLVSQKFKQFEGLCHSNLNPTPDEKFPTTIEDLQGFWDMVNLQIEHVDSLFKELDLIKANNWQPTKETTAPFVPTGSKLLKRPALKNGNTNNTVPTSPSIRTSPNAQLLAQKREAQRKQLLELKRKHKNAATADQGILSSPVEIYVSENCV